MYSFHGVNELINEMTFWEETTTSWIISLMQDNNYLPISFILITLVDGSLTRLYGALLDPPRPRRTGPPLSLLPPPEPLPPLEEAPRPRPLPLPPPRDFLLDAMISSRDMSILSSETILSTLGVSSLKMRCCLNSESGKKFRFEGEFLTANF